MVILIDHRLNELPGAFSVNFRIPEQTPDPRIIRITQRTTNLFSAEHPADSDLFFGQLEFRIALQRMHEVPSVDVEHD